MRTERKNNTYIAIIGDIKHSRDLADRQSVQQRFNDTLHKINHLYSEDIASQFVITLGDSFQGLLTDGAHVMNILFEIEMEMSPAEMRFGIGAGEIQTNIQLENSSEIDGPAYHRARDMIEKIEQTEKQYTKSETNILIHTGEENKQTDDLMNAIFSLSTALKSKWTHRQKEIITAYYKNGENQYKTAEFLKIGQSSVNKALNSAKFYTFQAAMNKVTVFMTEAKGVK